MLDPECQYFKDVKANLRPLASECYWLGCLMALNNAPLQPDWKNEIPVMNPWNVFPQNINVEEASSAKKKNCVI